MQAPSLGLTLVLLLASAATAAPPSDFYWLEDDPNEDCDGSTDNTTVLQDALDTVAANGGTLVLPNGKTCNYVGSLRIEDGAYFVIEGNGATLQGDGPDTTPDPDEEEGGIVIVDTHHFEIRNLTIEGSYTPSAESTCGLTAQLRMIDVYDALFTNVRTTHGWADGVVIRSPKATPVEDRSRNITFVNHTADENCEYGLWITEADNVQILGGRAVGNLGGSIASAGVRLEPNFSEEGFDRFHISRVLVSGMTISGNGGAGIHLGSGGEDGSNVTDVRIEGNVIADNDLGAFRIASGRNVIVRGNEISDHSLPDDDGVVWIHFKADRVTFDGNRFRNITAPYHVINVLAPTSPHTPNAITVSGNQFTDIAPSSDASSWSVINHAGNDAVVADNQMTDVTCHGITATGANAVVTGNVMRDMTGNVVYLTGADAVFSDNVIEIATAGTSANADAAVYTQTGATDGLMRSNTLLCSGTTQQGFYVSQTLQLFNDNSVKACASPGWASASGTVGSVMGDNRKY